MELLGRSRQRPAHDALRQLADSPRPPDVLICDYRLRDNENGIGVVEAIRNEFNTEIPALLITGDTDPDQIRRITASGLAILHKPLREDELHDAICALGNRRRRRREARTPTAFRAGTRRRAACIGLRAIGHAEHAEHRRNVHLHRDFRHAEPQPDFLVRKVQQRQDLRAAAA